MRTDPPTEAVPDVLVDDELLEEVDDPKIEKSEKLLVVQLTVFKATLTEHESSAFHEESYDRSKARTHRDL